MHNGYNITVHENRNYSVRRGLWKPVLLLVSILTIIAVSHIFGIGEKLGNLRTWIASLGAFGPLVYIVIYIAATVVALPGSALTVAAGAMFGSLVGLVSVSIASTVGAGLAFLVSRYVAREYFRDNRYSYGS